MPEDQEGKDRAYRGRPGASRGPRGANSTDNSGLLLRLRYDAGDCSAGGWAFTRQHGGNEDSDATAG